VAVAVRLIGWAACDSEEGRHCIGKQYVFKLSQPANRSPELLVGNFTEFVQL